LVETFSSFEQPERVREEFGEKKRKVKKKKVKKKKRRSEVVQTREASTNVK